MVPNNFQVQSTDASFDTEYNNDSFIDLIDGVVAANINQYPPFPVEAEHWCSLFVIDFQPLLDRRRGVIFAPLDLSAAPVALLAFFLCFYGVVRLAVATDVPVTQSAQLFMFGYLDSDHVVQVPGLGGQFFF